MSAPRPSIPSEKLQAIPTPPPIGSAIVKGLELPFSLSLPNHHLKQKFPWLKEPLAFTCSCERLHAPNALVVLAHYLDHHVNRLGDWSRDRLERYIETIAAERP